MLQLERAGGCSDGSSRVRLERRPDIVQVLEGDLLGTLDVSLAAVKWTARVSWPLILSLLPSLISARVCGEMTS